MAQEMSGDDPSGMSHGLRSQNSLENKEYEKDNFFSTFHCQYRMSQQVLDHGLVDFDV